jgi:hypothetical protein
MQKGGLKPAKKVGGQSVTPPPFGKKSGVRGVAHIGGGISGTPCLTLAQIRLLPSKILGKITDREELEGGLIGFSLHVLWIGG